MDTISQHDLANNSDAVLDALEDGKSFIIAREGVPIAMLRPYRRRPKVVTSAEMMEIARKWPPVDYEEMRRDIEEGFGSDRIGEDDDPWTRPRG